MCLRKVTISGYASLDQAKTGDLMMTKRSPSKTAIISIV